MPNYSSNASKEGVIAYLVVATGLDRVKVADVVAVHQAILDNGIRHRSFTYYIGNRIAAAAGLEYRDGFDEEEDEDE